MGSVIFAAKRLAPSLVEALGDHFDEFFAIIDGLERSLGSIDLEQLEIAQVVAKGVNQQLEFTS